MLTIQGLQAGYGGAQALFGVDLSVAEGEAVSLLGRNGMGKTTTVRAVMGLLRPWAGQVTFAGQCFAGASATRIARAGLGLVPEGRQIFPRLTVEENLLATAASRHGAARWTLPAIYTLFPRLEERRRFGGWQLSGGEQQMLAVGRALMTNPRLLILDEATEGLAPLARAEIWRCLTTLREEGMAMLVIDKNLDALLRLADHHVVLERGRVVWSGTSSALLADRAQVEQALHV
jgi:branched-chain amino acid transport system ATP-binding protein